ncbi:SCO family protein [Paenibacillus rigui]|uniref:Electron transport protein SCO1/SenC n=1 Tax=Paenibacillus rigui TaxID=554312 RepID=A0A229UJG4_9BACL|nr:SCO family protein [Paenibacillus rigui]OXM83039.1 electron transport protein SCO1/SenC [Paenibacillus rigui]
MKRHWFKLAIGLLFLVMLISVYRWMSQDNPVLPTVKLAPDFTLKDVDNKPFHFSQSNGTIRLVEFLFTSCPDICPTTTYNMVKIQNQLKQQHLWGNQVQFLSITFDPETDTPEVFIAYGDWMGMDYSGWTLLTGTEKETAEVANSFGVMVQKLPDGTFVHNVTSLMLVDRAGNIRKVFKMGEDMNNDEIIKMIRQIAES